MVIRSKFEVQTKPIDALVDYTKNYRDLVQEYGQDAFKQIEPHLLDELRFYPPPLPNQRYVRTYRLRGGWKAGIIQIGSDKFAMVISNDTEYAAMVVGSLAQSESVAANFQRSIHKNRWPLATLTVKFWQEAFLEILLETMVDDMNRLGTIKNKTRAFTSSTVGLS